MRGLQQEGGYLTLTQQQLERIVSTESISKYFTVEEEPFARGKYAAVRRCVELSSGREYAAKTLKKKPRAKDLGRTEILHEVAVLEACRSCRRIVSLHRVFESTQEIILVLELACGGELQTVLDSDDELPCEKHVQELMAEIIEGIAYLHNINVAHLDIKPQNLILTGEFPGCEVKLCDFGISRYLSQGADVREILGTPDYVAPEVLNYDTISLATDMWSVGVLLYVLLSGCSPFGGDTKQETFCNISQCRLDFPEDLFAEISEEAKDLITKLVVKTPGGRLTAEQCKKHPWFSRTFSEPLTPLIPTVQVPQTPNKPRTPIPLKRSMVPEEKPKPQTVTKSPKIESKTADEKNMVDNIDSVNNNEGKNVVVKSAGLSDERRKSLQSNLANLMEKLSVEEPKGRRVQRTDSLKRAAGMQTMPSLRYEELYKFRRVVVVDEDEGLPPSLASSSADNSSVSDSGSDRSSIVSLDDGLDLPRLRHYSSCLSVCEQRRPNPAFTQVLSKFREGERVVFRPHEERSKFHLFNSNRLSLPPLQLTVSRRSVGLESVREHNQNLVVIREVKAVQGKKYFTTSELKCETVQSRIQKLQQIKSTTRLQNNVF